MEFRPPRLNKTVMAICKWGLPLEHWRAQIEVEVRPGDIQRFQSYRDKHAVVIANHSDQYDPEVVFTLSKLVGEDFHFVAAREVFDWVFGSVGWWFQSLGCYSILRGEADAESFRTTREIIATGKRKLVVFPEGEVTRSPDFLMPLRKGATKLLFQAQGDLITEDGREPVYIVPVGIRWRYKHDITGWLDFIVGIIENHLKIKPAPGAGLAQRVYAAAAEMLTVMEEEYFCPVNNDLPYEERVSRLRGTMLAHIAQLVDVPEPEDRSQMVWLRRTLNAIHRFINEDMSGFSAYRKRMHSQQVRKLLRFVADCRKVQHLIGVAPPKQRRPMTQERLAAMVAKLEREVLGFVVPKGPRVAMVAVGEPVSLLDYWRQFQSDEDAAVAAATKEMSGSLQKLIDELDEHSRSKIKSRGSLPIEIR